MTQLRNLFTPGTIVAIAVAMSGAAYAQQQAPAPAADAYQGVSQPPPDDSIVASPDPVVAPAPAPVVAAKPSPATPAPVVQPATAVAYTAHAPAAYNPDDDIVGSVPTQGADQGAGRYTSPSAVTLATRDPDAGIVSVIPSPGNELPEGTNIRVRLTERLSTTETTAGTPFRGEVTTAVFKDGRIIIPPGSVLRGKVVSVRQGHHFTGAATMHLRPDMIVLPDGSAYHLYAQVIQSQAKGTRTDSEGGIQPSSHWKKNTIEYGVGAGTGALVGGQIAGPTGAVVGLGVGATLVTAHLLLQHPAAAVLPTGSVVTFSLSEPMELTPTRN